MDKTNDVAGIEKTVDRKRAKAESLGLDEKARLITSELGKRTVSTQYYPEALACTKVRYVGKAVPCSQYTLEIITWAEEDFADKSGRRETIIYVRKPLPLFSLLYRSKLVYSSEAPLGVPENFRVNTFNDKGDWLEDFEYLYSKALLDKEIRRSKALADREFKEVR
jgi:hypothetical protein